MTTAPASASDAPLEALVRRRITYTIDDTEYTGTIHVRRFSERDYERLVFDPADPRARTAAIIAMGIRLGERGEERISFKDAYRLRPEPAAAMTRAFEAVNTPVPVLWPPSR